MKHTPLFAFRSADDPALRYMRLVASDWTIDKALANAGTSHGPALCHANGTLYMAWNGIGKDNRLFWTRWVGHDFEPQRVVTGATAAGRPCLVAHGDRLHMAWNGEDESLWWATWTGSD